MNSPQPKCGDQDDIRSKLLSNQSTLNVLTQVALTLLPLLRFTINSCNSRLRSEVQSRARRGTPKFVDPKQGLTLLDQIDSQAVISYQPYWAVRAHFLRQLGVRRPLPRRTTALSDSATTRRPCFPDRTSQSFDASVSDR